MTDIVVGSGHSGALAAYALLLADRDVLMLDVGETIEEERDGLRRTLAATEPTEWSPEELERYRAPRQSRPTDLIRPYGSDFMFRDSEGRFSELPDWLGLLPSFARGGLSNGWGACVAPYRDLDLAAWPLGASDLAPYYRAVSEVVPIAGSRDDLLELFPAFEPNSESGLPASAQTIEILRRFRARSAAVEGLGATVGHARQAVSLDCKLCGLCLYGCPYGYIFNTARFIDGMTSSDRFTYRSGQFVKRFEEGADGVRVITDSGEFEGDRLFLGAGVLATARIVLSSLDDRAEVTLLDSEYFLAPSLHGWRTRTDPATEPHHTLSQIFVEVVDPRLTATTFHAQLYAHNDLYKADMRHRYGRWGGLASPIYDAVAKRLVVAQGFLHSDESRRIRLRLNKVEATARLEAILEENASTESTVGRAIERLSSVLRLAGLFLLKPLARRSRPGSSFHCGGTFPMSARPTGLETDTLGRPAGLERVHLIDSSTFPSIPATTIAFSTMANAYRIATLAGHRR